MKKEVYEISSKTKISNELARHEIPLIELSDLQKDMFMYLCIKAVENVEQKERKFNAPIELSMRDFFKYSIRSNFSQMNEDMKNECSEELLRLFKKTFYISTDKCCEYYHYVDYIHIDKETFTISAALSPMIEDLAYKTVKGYTQIEFGNYAALKRKYSTLLNKDNGVGSTVEASYELNEYFREREFDYPKPTSLIKYLVKIINNSSATVLDFFSGSGTTGQAVMELNAEDGGNRKFILVQLPEAVESKEYKTIDEIGRKRIELSAQKIKKEHPEYTGDLGFKHYTVKEVDADTIANMEEFDPNKNVVNIGDVITDDTIITTWLCTDGYGIDADVCKIDLSGYSAYMCENHLYLVDAGFKEEHLNALMKRIIEDPEFNIKYIVLFGYNFNDWSINEMMEKNTKVIKNSNKALNIDILTTALKGKYFLQ